MTMQLILNTDSAVEIKTKMSMNDENLEKCLTTVLPVANGDLPKGDILKENVKNGYKLGPVNEIGQKNSDGELNLDNDSSSNIDTDISHKSETTTASVTNEEQPNINKSSSEQLSDLLPEKDQKIESACNEADLIDSKQSNENSGDLDITAEQKDTNDNEAETAAEDINASNSSSNGPCESISAEEEQILLSNIDNENDTLDVDKSENNSSAEKYHTEPKNNETQLESNKINETDASENQDIEMSLDNNNVSNDNDITSNSNTDASDCATVAQELTDTPAIVMDTEEKGLNEKNTIDSSLDASRSNLVEKEQNIREVFETEINENDSSAIDHTVLLNNKDGIDIPKDDKINDTDMVTDFNSSTDDIDANSTLKLDELCSKEDDKEVDEENMSGKQVNENLDTSENKSLIEENQMEITEEEKSDDGNLIDLISLNDEKIQIIDEGPADGKEIEDVNMNIDGPVLEKKVEIMDITPDKFDDVIFNLDEDDKDQPNKGELKETEPIEKVDDDKPIISCDGDTEVANILNKAVSHDQKCNDDVIDLDDSALTTTADSKTSGAVIEEQTQFNVDTKSKSPILKLSNTLDILSDEEDDAKDTNKISKSINIEDDDDVVMLIDDPESKTNLVEESKDEPQVVEPKPDSKAENVEATEDIEKNEPVPEPIPAVISDKEATLVTDKEEIGITSAPKISEKIEEDKTETIVKKPLLHENFLNTCKKSLADMTREEIEEFCILKIVESILDRSNLSEIRNKLKTMSQTVDEYKKKALMLTKQNRDLQVVLKSIQEDQKKGTESIVPLKITRSVGMQVLMSDKPVQRRRVNPPANVPVNRPLRNPVPQSPRPQRPAAPQIPVPRLVPANNPAKPPSTPPVNAGKTPSPVPNGVRNPSPVQKGEKRTHNRMQSVTVDLTDDEPPPKVASRAPTPLPPVRLVPSQNLLAPPRAPVNSPRKVYIPISGPQGQNVRPGQTIMLKTVPTPPGPRPRCSPPHMVRMTPGMRMNRPQGLRHPAPLPDCMKQYQPPNWKALPPAPDLKLAKVENGIVISWKIEGYQEDSYEEIASYQLYAYQETSSPPNTALWKKIGDVKALPLPMACTLTQFMAGYKYYFAVRAVDIRSRLGPFSLPGSILLLNKM